MHRNKGACQPNKSCCPEQSQELQCSRKFNPPLLSSPTEFCAEVLAKGLPIPDCVLTKPKKLVVEKEAPPLAKLNTSRYIKNWQKWCYIWRQTYNTLTTRRNVEGRPPVMSSGEAHHYKKEDKELIDRTLHRFRLKGVYIKNATFPDSLPCDEDIKEVITDTQRRDYREMKKHRYPNHIRNEISIPPRKPHRRTIIQTPEPGYAVESKESLKGIDPNAPKGFDYEEAWSQNQYIQTKKEWLSCSFKLYGKIDPFAEELMLKPGEINDEPETVIQFPNKGVTKQSLNIPQLVITSAGGENEVVSANVNNNGDLPGDMYRYADFHGPILRVSSQFSDFVLVFSKAESEAPHLLPEPLEPLEGQYLYDENHHFSVTSRCKDMKQIELKNEGTTAIRYQWFRNPPNNDELKMLQDPTHYKTLRINPDGDNVYQEVQIGRKSGGLQSKVNKKTNLEFHFSELPNIILPGQSMEFPIMFRSKVPGYFEQTIYLLTHPKIKTQDGKQYAVHLSGICTNVELSENGVEVSEVESLKRFLDEKSLNEESAALIESILDRSVWDVDHPVKLEPSPEAQGTRRVTAESIFCPHNKNLYYHSKTAERAVEIARELIEILVPRERVEETQACISSIQSLYNLLMTAKNEGDLNWQNLRNEDVEGLLDELNDCLMTLTESRLYSWPEIERRKTRMHMSHIAYESIFSEL